MVIDAKVDKVVVSSSATDGQNAERTAKVMVQRIMETIDAL